MTRMHCLTNMHCSTRIQVVLNIDFWNCLILDPKLNPKLNRIQVVLHIDFWNFVDLTATEVEGLGTSLNPKLNPELPPPRGLGARD